jgi:hypothetical protein
MEDNQRTKIFEDLDNATTVADYAKIVDDNINVILSSDQEWFFEIFMSDNRTAISFWIDTPLRMLSINDLSVINYDNEDLFYIGLNNPKIDLNGANSLVVDWEDDFNMNHETEDQRKITRRKITAIKQKLQQ